jgi:hypothetical protein
MDRSPQQDLSASSRVELLEYAVLPIGSDISSSIWSMNTAPFSAIGLDYYSRVLDEHKGLSVAAILVCQEMKITH